MFSCGSLLVLLYACTEGTLNTKTPRAQTALFAYMLADNDLELFALHGITHTGLRLTARLKVMHRSEMRIIITHEGSIRTE